jgi:biotin synthase-related radical SAM superfamily protein
MQDDIGDWILPVGKGEEEALQTYQSNGDEDIEINKDEEKRHKIKKGKQGDHAGEAKWRRIETRVKILGKAPDGIGK